MLADSIYIEFKARHHLLSPSVINFSITLYFYVCKHISVQGLPWKTFEYMGTFVSLPAAQILLRFSRPDLISIGKNPTSRREEEKSRPLLQSTPCCICPDLRWGCFDISSTHSSHRPPNVDYITRTNGSLVAGSTAFFSPLRE